MTAEEELKEFKIQSLKDARKTATISGLIAVITIISLVYVYTWGINMSTKADIQSAELIDSKEHIVVLKKNLEACKKLTIHPEGK